MSTYQLSPTQIKQYRTEGYLVVPGIFDRQALDRVDAAIDELVRQALDRPEDAGQIVELEPETVDGKHVPRRILNPFDQHEAFRALATDERLLDRIESLIGLDIGIHHSKLNAKPARVGSVVEWHQDMAYFPHTNDDLVTTLIYLEDTTQENGCLQVLPRHHTHYFDHRTEDGTFAGMITEPIDDGRFGRPVSLIGPAGSVIFMHCLTPHSSAPNHSERSRRTLIYEYRAADAYPIFFGSYVSVSEAHAHHLRGDRIDLARLGGPSPRIPRMPASEEYKSLYTLQAESRSRKEHQSRPLTSSPA